MSGGKSLAPDATPSCPRRIDLLTCEVPLSFFVNDPNRLTCYFQVLRAGEEERNILITHATEVGLRHAHMPAMEVPTSLFGRLLPRLLNVDRGHRLEHLGMRTDSFSLCRGFAKQYAAVGKWLTGCDIHFSLHRSAPYDDSPANTDEQWFQPWFQSGAKWILSIHSMVH